MKKTNLFWSHIIHFKTSKTIQPPKQTDKLIDLKGDKLLIDQRVSIVLINSS